MKKLIRMSLFATAGMTFFSYLASLFAGEKFLEPLALNQLFFPRDKKRRAHHFAGYAVHYLVGLFFSVFYIPVWKTGKLKAGLFSGAWMGFLNGLVGISGWHIAFRLHRRPPEIKLKQYYFQLILAHIVFGIINSLTFKNKR